MDTKFYRTEFKVVLLSDRPMANLDIRQIAMEMTTGDASGELKCVSAEEVPRDKISEMLIAQGSDPSFLIIEYEDSPEKK